MTNYSLNEDTGNCESSVSDSLAASVALGVIGGSIGSGSLVFLGLHIYRKKKEKKLTDSSDMAYRKKKLSDSSDMAKTEENQESAKELGES